MLAAADADERFHPAEDQQQRATTQQVPTSPKHHLHHSLGRFKPERPLNCSAHESVQEISIYINIYPVLPQPAERNAPLLLLSKATTTALHSARTKAQIWAGQKLGIGTKGGDEKPCWNSCCQCEGELDVN